MAPAAAGASPATGWVAGAIFNITPDAPDMSLQARPSSSSLRGALIASEHERPRGSFRLRAAPGRYRLTSTDPCSIAVSVVTIRLAARRTKTC